MIFYPSPFILGCLASDAFSVRFDLVPLHFFFQFFPLCNSLICVLFPLENTF